MAFCVTEFRITNDGRYTFSLKEATPGGDLHTLLYEHSFDPASPMGNVLTGNDCAKTGATFSYALSTGKRYFFVIVGNGHEALDPCSYKIAGAGHVIHQGSHMGQQHEPFEQMAVTLASMLAIARRKSVSQSLGRPASLLTQANSGMGGMGNNVHAIGVPDPSQSGTAAYGHYLPLKSFLRQVG